MALQDISLAFLIIFSLLSSIDGVYIHLFRYRLHENQDSKKEHVLHTLRSIFFFLILMFIYYFKASGFWLFIGCGVVFIDYIIESMDMFEEKESRKEIGGLTNFEYWIHGTLIMLRSLSLGLWFSTFSSARFFEEKSALVVNLEGHSLFIVEQIMISTLLVAGLHIVLIFQPNFFNLFRMRCCHSGAE